MNDEERLIVALEARVRDFERKMERAERRASGNYRGMRRDSRSATRAMERDMARSSKRINQSLSTTSGKIGMLSKAARGPAIVAASLTALAVQSGRAVRSMSELGDAAKRAGMDVEAFQEWRFVAEQNRIGIDVLTDGFKELSLRADEFIVTGTGPAEEAFKRLGFSATELKHRLDDPSALMLELIGRMKGLDRAAQIRVADEIFGGTAGERFVELLSLGQDGIQGMIDRAHEMGVVLDREVIERATELDRRFADLRLQADTMFKGLVVGAADFAAEVVNLRQDLDDLFRSYDQARGLLGDDVADVLDGDSAAVAKHADEITQLRRSYEETADSANALVPILQNAGFVMQSLGYEERAREIFDAAERMRELSGELRDGTVSAGEFEAEMSVLATTSRDTLNELKDIGHTDFEPAISGVSSLIQNLGAAIVRARELRAELPGGEAFEAADDPDDTPDEAPPPAPPGRPRARPNDIDFGYHPPPPSSGRSGGSGGGSQKTEVSEFARLVKETREEIAKLNAEASSLTIVAESGEDVGDALEYARRRAELLYEAQKAGKALTPALRAEIDELALSYTKAGQAAEDAADKLQLVEQYAERGADRLTDVFMSIIDGSSSAKEALAGLLMQMARVQIQQGILGIANSGGGLGEAVRMIGQSLVPSYAGGGFTGHGPRSGGIDGRGGFPAILHPNETVIDHTRGNSGGIGGMVRIVIEEAPGFAAAVRAEAEGVAVEVTRAGLEHYDRQMPQRMRQINRNPRDI